MKVQKEIDYTAYINGFEGRRLAAPDDRPSRRITLRAQQPPYSGPADAQLDFACVAHGKRFSSHMGAGTPLLNPRLSKWRRVDTCKASCV